MAAPSVSVIVATRDRPARLLGALASVIAQDTPALEVRIGDDGDVPVVERLPHVPLLELTAVKVRAGHDGAARNAAAAGARGDVLAFLDDRDRWRPDHLAGVVRAFADPALAFAWSDGEIVRGDDGVAPHARVAVMRNAEAATLRAIGGPPPSTWAVRRSLFESLGGFDETLRCAEDHDFVLRALVLTPPRRLPGITVELGARDANDGADEAGEGWRDALARLAARHGLPHLDVRTFGHGASWLGAAR